MRVRLAAVLAILVGCTQAEPGAADEQDHYPAQFAEPCAGSDCAPEIPMTGRVSPAFTELDTAMRQFMKFRCVGAGVLGVSLRGRRIYKRGFGRMLGPAAPDLPGCNDGAMAGLDPFVADAAHVRPDTPVPVGSVSKVVTASMVRPLIAARIAERGLTSVYPTPTHARVFDPALGLLPADVIAAVAGEVCGPVTVDDFATCERACGGHGPDVRLRDVTVGDLLAHTSGLHREAADWMTWVVPNIDRLRGYTDEASFAAEHAALRARYPQFAADLDSTRTWLSNHLGTRDNIYFVSRYDVRREDPQHEWLGVFLTRCLATTPRGTTDDTPSSGPYSNTNFAVLAQIVAHLGAGGRYAAEAGHPDQHAGSQLATFLAQLGIDGGVETREGIFHRSKAVGLTDWNPPVPEPREWSPDKRAYVWPKADHKRPFCVWNGVSCDFTRWRTDADVRPSWRFDGAPQRVGLDQWEEGLTIGTGALGVEAPALLRIVGHHAIGTDDVAQGIVRADCGPACARFMIKNGGQGGAHAYVMSLVGGPGECDLPTLDEHGRLTEFGAHTEVQIEDYPGVDIVVGITQNADGKRSSTMQYAWLDDVVRFGLSRVDWPQIEAELAAQASTVIGLAIDDHGDTTYWFADDSYAIHQGPPRGPLAGELLDHGPVTFPATRIGPDVLAMTRQDDAVITWYDDGHASIGTTTALGAIERSLDYVPASGHAYTDLVAAAITADGQVLAIYRDGTTSRGTRTDLDAHTTGELTLPSGHDPKDITAITLDGADLVILTRDDTILRTPLATAAP